MVISSLILFTIAVLGIIAWISFTKVDRNSNNELRTPTVKPATINKDLRLETGEELYPIENGRKKDIPQIITSLPITTDDMLQELEQSENKLQKELFKELQNQLSETAEMLNQITEQFLISEMLHTMEGQFLRIQQTISLDPLQSIPSTSIDVEKIQ